MSERKSGLDIYRILCCIGVLTYHVMDDVLGTAGAKIIYFSASFCVPGFFMLSGYLIGSKKELTLEYCERKVIETIKKLFLWTVFWVILHFIKTGEMYNLWENVTASAYSGGILPVGWFLFTYCILLIVAYPLHIVMKRWPKIFTFMCLIWCTLLALGIGKKQIYTKTQSLWFCLYIGYFAVGMALAYVMEFLQKCKWVKVCLIALSLIFVLSTVVYGYQIQTAEIFKAPHEYYGDWYYSIWLISGFSICCLLKGGNEKLSRILKLLSSNTFVVYLGHLPILLYMTTMKPLATTVEAIIYILALFIGLEIVAEIFKKLPIFRRLI